MHKNMPKLGNHLHLKPALLPVVQGTVGKLTLHLGSAFSSMAPISQQYLEPAPGKGSEHEKMPVVLQDGGEEAGGFLAHR